MYNEKGFTFEAVRDTEKKLREDIKREFNITVTSLVVMNILPLQMV